MSLSALEALVASGESEVAEFKRSTGLRREGAQTLCAMLNTRGGRLLFGIEAPGRVVGQQVGDRTLEDVSTEIREIEPPVFPTVDRLPLGDGKEVILVKVQQGQTRPYTYRGKGYRRIGNTTVELSREEYNRMLLERLHGEQRWETEKATDWTLADLDTNEIIRTVEESVRRGRQGDPGTRDPESLLRGLGLIREGALIRAAGVLFGRRTPLETRLPQCLLRVARFRGTDKTEFVDNRQFHGNAFKLLTRADRFLRETLPVAGRVVPGLFSRADDPLYPTMALREALANAVCHRDYSIGGGSVALAVFDDRLEISSSGTLHFGLTVEDLFRDHESMPWNPIIASVFYRRGIVERWGRGTIVMKELAQQAGLPPPEIEEAGGCVTVRFRPDRYIPPERVQTTLTPSQREVLLLLESEGQLALRQIKSALAGAPEWSIKSDLATLKNLGLIETAGYGRGAYWYRTR